MAARGWLRRGADGVLELSPAGLAAHASVSDRVRTSRRALTDGISPEEYAAVVGLLERMAGNLVAAQ